MLVLLRFKLSRSYIAFMSAYLASDEGSSLMCSLERACDYEVKLDTKILKRFCYICYLFFTSNGEWSSKVAAAKRESFAGLAMTENE